MTVADIIRAYLAAHGYDGLWSPDGECACLASDLRPCNEPMGSCRPGYKTPCDCGEHDWHIAAAREAEEPNA